MRFFCRLIMIGCLAIAGLVHAESQHVAVLKLISGSVVVLRAGETL